MFRFFHSSHRRGILDILNIRDTPEVTRATVADAIKQWSKVEFETAGAAKQMCATALRSFSEWDTHPHARALLGTPPVTITKIGEAPKRLVVPGNYLRPLDGIRVIDIGRVLAGPIAGRTLAGNQLSQLFP